MFQEPDENTPVYVSPYDRKPRGRPKQYTNDEIAVVRNEIAKKYYQDNLAHCKEIQKSYNQRNKEKILEKCKIKYAKKNQIQEVIN